MSARKLPEIAPCPHGKRGAVREGLDLYWVVCACGWTGPIRKSERAAIIAWNRRTSEPADREKLMRDGAMAALTWLETTVAGLKNPDPLQLNLACCLREAIDRGEVIPKREPEREPWIVSRPGVMGGKPCVRGTRITVETLQVAAKGWLQWRILKEYPSITAEGLAAALAYRLPKAKRGGRKV